MRHKPLLLALALLILLPITASRSDAKGDINFMLGFKQVEDFGDLQEELSGEDDLGTQFDVGVEMTFRGADWPIGIAVDLLGSGREEELDYYYLAYSAEFDAEASTFEIDLGVRKIWEPAGKPVRPYVGGGVSVARGEIELSGEVFIPAIPATISFSGSEDDTGVGYWLGGGVYWRIGERFNIGLNARYSSAEVEFDGSEDVDVGGVHVGMLLGWGW